MGRWIWVADGMKAPFSGPKLPVLEASIPTTHQLYAKSPSGTRLLVILGLGLELTCFAADLPHNATSWVPVYLSVLTTYRCVGS